MKGKYVLIVGDKFAPFAAGKDVMTLTQLKECLDAPNAPIPIQGHTTLIPGQGLGDRDVEQLLELAARSPRRDHFDFHQWYNLPKRVESSRSHKRQPENTLISEPRRLAEDLFEMHLLIDENCELMSDHQTGQHVQGMLLIEAARQASLAVTETFFLAQNGSRYSFVFNGMSVSYNQFAFPLPARLRYSIREKDVSKPKRQTFVNDIMIEQCGTETASFSMSFAVFEAGRIGNRENNLANRAVSEYLANIAAHDRNREPEHGIAVNA